jgi:hypothetical protein
MEEMAPDFGLSACKRESGNRKSQSHKISNAVFGCIEFECGIELD